MFACLLSSMDDQVFIWLYHSMKMGTMQMRGTHLQEKKRKEFGIKRKKLF